MRSSGDEGAPPRDFGGTLVAAQTGMRRAERDAAAAQERVHALEVELLEARDGAKRQVQGWAEERARLEGVRDAALGRVEALGNEVAMAQEALSRVQDELAREGEQRKVEAATLRAQLAAASARDERADSGARRRASELEADVKRLEAAAAEVPKLQARAAELQAAAGDVAELRAHVQTLQAEARELPRLCAHVSKLEGSVEAAHAGRLVAEQRLVAAEAVARERRRFSHDEVSTLQSQLAEAHMRAEAENHAAKKQRSRLQADESATKAQAQAAGARLQELEQELASLRRESGQLLHELQTCREALETAKGRVQLTAESLAAAEVRAVAAEAALAARDMARTAPATPASDAEIAAAWGLSDQRSRKTGSGAGEAAAAAALAAAEVRLRALDTALAEERTARERAGEELRAARVAAEAQAAAWREALEGLRGEFGEMMQQWSDASAAWDAERQALETELDAAEARLANAGLAVAA